MPPLGFAIVWGCGTGFVLLCLGFSGASHNALWCLIAGLVFAGIVLGRSAKTHFLAGPPLLTMPSLYLTVLTAFERFSKHRTAEARFDLMLSAGMIMAAFLGVFLGRLSLRGTRPR